MPFDILDVAKAAMNYVQENTTEPGPFGMYQEGVKAGTAKPTVPQNTEYQNAVQSSQALLAQSNAKFAQMEKDEVSGTVDAYRPDPQGKFGGKDGMETQPYKYHTFPIEDNITALVKSKDLGVPQLTAKQLATLLLKEGREDFGTNSVKVKTKDGKVEYYDHDPNRPQEAKLYQNVLDKGFNTTAASFVTRMATKMETAKRLGIPFALAWNGTGKATDRFTNTKADGHKYANEYHYFEEAANHPKNKEFVKLIESIIKNASGSTKMASK